MVVFPIVATILAFGCAAAVARDYLARPRPNGLVWTIAFAVFGAAALCEVIGSLSGWTPLIARTYYVLGATLVVGYLALGELYLLMRRSWADKASGVMILLTALSVALISKTPIGPNVADEGWRALEPSAGMTALTVGINSGGTLILVGGLLFSVYSFRRKGIMRNRMIGCLLIAIGTLAVASGGTLTRFGSHQLLYIAMSIGIALIFAGYLWTRKPDAKPVATPAPAAAPAQVIAPISFRSSRVDEPKATTAADQIPAETITLRLTLERRADGQWRLLSGEVEGDEPTTLRRDEVTLRPVVPADIATLFAYQDAVIASTLAAFPSQDREAFTARWERILADAAIEKRAIAMNGAVVGAVVCFDVLGERHLGYWLDRSLWDHGVATNALTLFLSEILTRPLNAEVAACNAAARRVVEACGFMLVSADERLSNLRYELRA